MPTAPTNVNVASTTPTSVTLAWTPGAGDHVDIYRAQVARQGYFGTFSKINGSPVDIAATGYVDSTAQAQQHYSYIVFAVGTDASMAPANPAWATTWSGTDAAAAIRAGIIGRIGGVLPSDWKEMPYQIDPKKNDRTRRNKAYGVLMGPDSLADGVIGTYDKFQKYAILLGRQVSATAQSDADLIAVKMDLATKIEQINVDLVKSKCGVPGIVVITKPGQKQEPEFFQDDSLVVVRMEIEAQFRITV